MSFAALALTAALLAPQDPVTHQQAVTCTGVFVIASTYAAMAAESDPSTEAQEFVEITGRLTKAADADRLAAAAREGVAVEASGQALNAWLEASVPDAEAVVGRELEACLGRYMGVL